MLPSLFHSYFKFYKGFNKAVWLNVFAVFINTFGFITGSFFALYLVNEKGFTIPTASIFMSLGAIGSIVGAYIGGRLADRHSPVKLAQLSLFLFALGMLSFPFINIPSCIFLMLIFVNVVYSAFRPVNNIILLAHSSVVDRPRVMGMYRMAFNLGLAFSMAIGGFLAERNFSFYFFFAGTMSLIATSLFVKFQDSMQIPPSWHPAIEEGAKKFSFWQIFQDRRFMRLCLLYLGYCLIYFQVRMTFALYMTETYHLSLMVFGYLYVINFLMVVLLEVPFMDILKRHHQINVCMWGIVFIAFGLGILPLGHGALFAAFSVFLWSLGEIFTSSPFYVLVMEYANPQAKGTYLGFFQSVMSVGSILFPIIGGFLYSIDQGKVLWFGCFFASFVLIWGFMRLKRMG